MCVAELATVDGSRSPCWAVASVSNTSSSPEVPARATDGAVPSKAVDAAAVVDRTGKLGAASVADVATARAVPRFRSASMATPPACPCVEEDGMEPIRRLGTRERRRSDRALDVPVIPFRRIRPPLRPRPGAARPARRRHLRHGCWSGTALAACFVRDRGRLGRRRGTGRTGAIRRGERQHLGERLRIVLGRVPASNGDRGRHVPGSFGRADHGRRGTHVVTEPDWPDRPARESTAGTYAWVSA